MTARQSSIGSRAGVDAHAGVPATLPQSSPGVVNLARYDGSPRWHVLNPTHGKPLALCSVAGTPSEVEVGVDARVILHRGKWVCGNCRRRLH